MRYLGVELEDALSIAERIDIGAILANGPAVRHAESGVALVRRWLAFSPYLPYSASQTIGGLTEISLFRVLRKGLPFQVTSPTQTTQSGLLDRQPAQMLPVRY